MGLMRKIRTGSRVVPFMMVNRLCAAVTKVKPDRVLFASDVRAELGGNLKFVYDYLPERFDKVVDLKEDRRYRRSLTAYLRLAYYLATSKYILLEDFLDYTAFMKLRDGQQICQLWHGAGAYKKFAFSREANASEHIKIHTGYKRYAKAIVSAESIRSCYAEAFSIPLERVKATGIPRTDIFFDQGYIERKEQELRQRYPMIQGKKVILFAPTYRGTQVRDAAYDFEKLDLAYLYQRLHGDYVFLFKWHPAAYNNLKAHETAAYDLSGYPDFYLDVSEFRDINDLLLIADTLITDYSSVIFEYLLTNKPIIYYVHDLDEYEGGRGLYFPFSDYVYGDVVKTLPELVDSIRAENMAEEQRAAFCERFMKECDGKSTEKTCQWLFGFLDSKQIK